MRYKFMILILCKIINQSKNMTPYKTTKHPIITTNTAVCSQLKSSRTDRGTRRRIHAADWNRPESYFVRLCDAAFIKTHVLLIKTFPDSEGHDDSELVVPVERPDKGGRKTNAKLLLHTLSKLLRVFPGFPKAAPWIKMFAYFVSGLTLFVLCYRRRCFHSRSGSESSLDSISTLQGMV